MQELQCFMTLKMSLRYTLQTEIAVFRFCLCWWVGSKQDFTRVNCKRQRRYIKKIFGFGTGDAVNPQIHSKKKQLQALGIAWVKSKDNPLYYFPASWQWGVSWLGENTKIMCSLVFTFSSQYDKFCWEAAIKSCRLCHLHCWYMQGLAIHRGEKYQC